jgi:predicted RNase H-like nuclease
LDHLPQSRLGQSKDAAYKKPKIKRAGNAQRKHEVHPHSALAVFLTALLTRAGERTARTLLQRKYRRIRETQHASGVLFHTTKQN